MLASNSETNMELGLSIINLVLCFALFIASATTPMPLDAEEGDDLTVMSTGNLKTSTGRILCPEATASPLSWIFFQWIDPLLWLGYKNPLEMKDLWELTHYHRTKECFEELSETKKL